jgi:EEF1A lysine methyltransferase 4
MAKEEELIELAHPEYWDQRYTAEQKPGENGTHLALDSYEWFRNFETLRPFFAKHLPVPPSNWHILHLGCGNSVSPTFLSSYFPPLLSYNLPFLSVDYSFVL